MPKMTIEVEYRRTDGPKVDEDEIIEGLVDSLELHTFEAGDEPSVFEVQSASGV